MEYQTVIGLEIHVQLKTNSKIFCGDATDFGKSPNSQVSSISLAHPGTLPKLNKEVIPLAVRMGIALNCEINRVNRFDRKHYFYPDSPSGYQITQQHEPICRKGGIPIETSAGNKIVPLNKIHLEADAGKLIHADGQSYSQVDLNRAGMPLIEMVTEPEIYSAEEAGAVLEEIRKLVRFLEVGDGNMEEGSLRCDANISVRPMDQDQLGQKVEIKNMNSIRYVKKAIEYEVRRQVALLKNGEAIQQETRLFDVESGTTSGMREKEEADDYRYFTDPDLPVFTISDDYIEQVRASMGLTPGQYKTKFIVDYGLGDYDASVLTEEKFLAEWLVAMVDEGIDPKNAANWLMGPVKGLWNDSTPETFNLQPAQLIDLVNLVNTNVVNNNIAVKTVLPELNKHPAVEAREIITQQGLEKENDEGALASMISDILTDMPQEVEAYQKGRKALLKRFIGEVMKRSKGKADPKETANLLKKMLDNR